MAAMLRAAGVTIPSARTRRLADVSATDVVLAAGPTTVALATIGAEIWRQRRGFRHERTIVDLEATRALLDDAAMALHDGDYARHDVEGRHGGPGLVEACKAIDRLSERLAVRLGPDHDAVKHYRAANAALLHLQLTIGAPDLAEVEEIADHHENFQSARAGFLAAAAETAGAQLP
jgi:hypothetical protein